MASWDYPAVAAPRTADYAPPVQDFSKFNLLDDFVKGRQEGRAEDKANAFRNGIPRDSNGDPDFNKISDTAAKVGGIDYALPLLNLQMQRQSGQQGGSDIQGAASIAQGGQPAQRAPGAGPTQPPAAPAAAAQPTVMTILAAQGVPNDQLDAAAASVSRQLGVGPTDPIDTKDPQVRNVLGPAIQRIKGVGQVVTPQAGPQPTAQPEAAATGAVASPVQTAQAEAPDANLQQADRYAAAQSFMRAKAAQVASYNPKLAETYNKTADDYGVKEKQLRDLSIASETPTPDQKNYEADKLPGESMVDYQARAAAAAEGGKQDATAYSKKYEGIQKAAVEASIEQPKIQLMKQFANDPNFYSGPLEPTNRGFKQFAATIGADPNKALPQEGFNKVASDMLTSQIRALGASGAGPVRIAEVKNMQKSIANLGITPVTNRLLVEITDRTYNDVKAIADLTRKYETNPKNLPGKKNVGLDTAIQDYYDKHPIFTDAEKNDPRLIAPPEFKDSRLAFNAKLPKGQPVKIDGKLKWVQ